MRFVIESFDLVRMRLPFSVALDLFGKESQILHVILLLQLCLVLDLREISEELLVLVNKPRFEGGLLDCTRCGLEAFVNANDLWSQLSLGVCLSVVDISSILVVIALSLLWRIHNLVWVLLCLLGL